MWKKFDEVAVNGVKKCKHCKSDTGFLDVVLTFLG